MSLDSQPHVHSAGLSRREMLQVGYSGLLGLGLSSLTATSAQSTGSKPAKGGSGKAKSIVIAFMTKESLDKFRNSQGWKVGVDGSVALIDLGAGKTIDSSNIKDPVVGFVFGSKGLMYNLTLEGTKIHKLDKS